MVLADYLRARLLAALRPWLAADPAELRVEPGLFARSRAVARGVELDPAALNAAAGAGATFDRAAAAEVELAASPWAAPAIDAVVRGIDVALTLRDPAPKKQRPDYKEWLSKEKKRVLASLDPQGEMLHEMIEGVVNSLGDKFASVFATVLLNCSQVRLHDVTIRVRYLDDSHVLVLRTTDLRFGPELVFRSSLFRGLVGSFIPSRKKNSLLVRCSEFEFLMKENDSVDCSASFTGISASVRLDNLQLAGFGIHVDKACWEISPKFAPSLMVILDITSQKEEFVVRNGRELWKIAAQKLGSSVVRRRFSLGKSVSCATFWRRYVHAYVLLLALVGYPSDKIIARNCGRGSRSRKLWSTVKDQWETVINLEEKIPAEAIARARCAARSKLTVSQQPSKQESSKALLVSSLLKILTPFLYLWRFLVFIWMSVWATVGPGNKASYAHIFPVSTHDVDTELQLSVHLGELSVTLLPVTDRFTDTKRSDKRNKTYQIDLPVNIVMRSSCLLYSAGCTTQSLFLVVGELTACLSGVPKLLQADNSNSPRRSPSFRTAEFTEDADSRILLWSDSASMDLLSRQQANGSFYYNDDLPTDLIKSNMDELWSTWMTISNLYNESGVIHHEKPSVIFEFKYFLIDPYKGISGFRQCRFTVGRLNLDLDYLCASSTYLLYRQFMHHKQLKELTVRSADLSNSAGTYVAPTSGLVDKLRSYDHGMKVAMLGVIPENTLQIVALAAGPRIRLFFDKYNTLQNSKDVYNPLLSQMNSRSIVFSLAYVECALWPASLASPTLMSAKSHAKESHSTFISVKEAQEHHQLQTERSARNVYPGYIVLDGWFVFAGLTLLIDNPEANQQCHIFGPMTANFQISTSRKYFYSFFGVSDIISVKLGARIAGCIGFFCMDELLIVCQLIGSMHLEVLKSDLGNIKYSEDFIGRLASFYKNDIQGSIMELVEHIAQEDKVDPHVELSVEMQLDLESAYIIFSASRDVLFTNPAEFINSFINYISSSPVFGGIATQELLDVLAPGVGICIRSSSMKLLLNGQCTDFLVSLSGIQGVVLENPGEMGIFNDIHQHGDISNGSLHSENQFIISECVFNISVGPMNANLIDEKLQDESRSCCISYLGIWYSIKIEFTEVYVGDYSIHSYLSELSQRNKHKISLLIHDDLQVVKCKIQGGLIFLETVSLAKLVLCCKVYFWLLVNLPLRATSNLVKDSVTPISAGGNYIVTTRDSEREAAAVPLGTNVQSEGSQLNAIKCLDIELCCLSLTLVVADKSGTHQGLTFEVDASLQQINLGMEFLFEVKRLSISTISSICKNANEQLRDVPAPRFRSSKAADLSPQSEIQEYLPFVEADNMDTYDHDAPSSSTSALRSSTDNTSLDFSSHENQILKHFSSYLKIERKKFDGDSSLVHLTGDWSGSGSVSGLEVTMSLSNIEMVSSLLAPFYGIMSSGSTQKEIPSGGITHQAQLDNMDYTIPDGAIVAIRDLNQQMYVSVKNTGNTYQVVGAYHYSLAGEHALFKVKHHKRWRSNIQCISLLSLCAKNDEGKELALSFSKGSDFVEVSSYVDKPCSIWSTLPFRTDNFDDDGDDGKSYKVIPRSSYHLVNKKYNYGIAFVDGLLEFVKKPGNPFKVQIFDESIVPHMSLDNNTYLDVEDDVPFSVRDRLASGASSQHVIINVDKIVFTITHEVFDTDNVFPLVQTCISDIRVVTQIFPSKIRILSSFKVSGQYFDARRNLWHFTFDDNISHDQDVVSICLFKEGVFSTIPISISLHESGIFAWRTRVSPVKDLRSFSGPFVVVKVSRNSEEGLSLSVQPLLRVYNKSDFPIELRFQRPNKTNEEAAFVTVRSGDMVDESTGVFDAMDLSGGSKRALMSLALGKFMLSIRPEISEYSENISQPASVNWSEDITGEKAIRISGVIEKLNYNLRKAFNVDSMKSSFSTLSCPLFANGHHVTDLHFLIHTLGRDVPVQPTNGTRLSERSAPVTLQVQREIFIYPTVQVHNFLQTDIQVVLTDCQQVTLISYGSKSMAVSSSDWVKRMRKQTSGAQYLDMLLEFVPGNFHSSLRLLRQDKGLLEVALFTRYTLHNISDYPLQCTPSHQKPLPASESGMNNINLPPRHGCVLPSMSMNSWFIKSSKLRISLHSEKGSEAIIDLEALSGFTEFFIEIQDNIAPHRMAAFGVSLQPVMYNLPVPSQVVLIVPRYVVSNESGAAIAVRQCFVEHEIDGLTVEAKQRATLQTWKPGKKREINYFDLFVKKHRDVFEDSRIFIQFCPKEPGFSWSGPICVSSIGRFFLKFRRSDGMLTDGIKRDPINDGKLKLFASVDVVQETTSFVLHFTKPPKVTLPYRIENYLNEASIMYFQKDSVESDVLCPQESEQYAWDDLSLPRKLIVRIVDTPALREIKIDKISPWKPFLKMRQNTRLNLDFSFSDGLSSRKQRFDESFGLRVFKIGYEVYADGLTRVLRICEHADNPKIEKIQRPIASLQFRISYVCIHLLDKGQSGENVQLPSTIVTAKLQHVSADSVVTDSFKHGSVAIHSVNVDEKWDGASFGSILRRNKLQDAALDENILRIVFVLNSTNSNVKQIQYCSIILQPVDLKIDEETLMKLVPFWRASLAPSGTPSTQFYFRHFEVHPIKIIASFRPGSRRTTYSSAQEALRALLHSFIKVPEVSNSAVELNGVLLNHALVTFRELLLKCAQHYSWYVLRAIYVTKGSSLLPPSFTSIFDDSASSVLDVFFDPSDGLLNVPGLTIGMFKFISQNMKSGGFSGTKRYLGDLGKTVKTAGSNALFAAVTEISDSVVRGAETNGLNGMVTGFHQGIMRLAMEPSVLGQALMEGGPDRKIKLDHSPGIDELYIEGYLQAMLDVMYKQEYLRVRVVDDQVILKNLPPNSALINEIVDNVKSFLVSKALLKGDSSTLRPLRHLRNEREWRIAPTVLTLCEHLFVSFAVRVLHREASKAIGEVMARAKKPATGGEGEGDSSPSGGVLLKRNRLWTVGRFAVSGMVAYVDGRLCRHIPNPIARRIVSGFLLSFIENRGNE
uniref:Vacuolar protein sorting-associated protein 13 VPS13 adaptor binding domain-containing protein n=1 Tax=Setaria italica TaxID=4555 RepID=K3Z322_SETIT